MKEIFRKCAPAFLGLLVFAGCAGTQPLATIEPESGHTVIGMKAENFKFVPNNIEVRKGPVVFRIENVSGTEHNFTLKDPQEHVLRDADIPPGETVAVEVDFVAPGVYTFICDEPFHAALGMKGRIEVAGKPGGETPLREGLKERGGRSGDPPQTAAVPGRPKGLYLDVTPKGLELTWIPSPEDPGSVTGYEIWRSLTYEGPYRVVAAISSGKIHYTDGTVSPQVLYYYKIRATAGDRYSSFSNVAIGDWPGKEQQGEEQKQP